MFRYHTRFSANSSGLILYYIYRHREEIKQVFLYTCWQHNELETCLLLSILLTVHVDQLCGDVEEFSIICFILDILKESGRLSTIPWHVDIGMRWGHEIIIGWLIEEIRKRVNYYIYSSSQLFPIYFTVWVFFYIYIYIYIYIIVFTLKLSWKK